MPVGPKFIPNGTAIPRKTTVTKLPKNLKLVLVQNNKNETSPQLKKSGTFATKGVPKADAEPAVKTAAEAISIEERRQKLE